MFLDKFCNLLPVLLLRESAIHCQRLEVSAWPLVTGQPGNTRDCCGCLFLSHRLIPLINTGLLDHQRRMVDRYRKPITFCLSIPLQRAGGIKFHFCQLLRWTCYKKKEFKRKISSYFKYCNGSWTYLLSYSVLRPQRIWIRLAPHTSSIHLYLASKSNPHFRCVAIFVVT